MGTLLLFIIAGVGFSFLAIMLSYLAVLCSGAQSVTTDQDTRYSNSSNKYKKV